MINNQGKMTSVSLFGSFSCGWGFLRITVWLNTEMANPNSEIESTYLHLIFQVSKRRGNNILPNTDTVTRIAKTVDENPRICAKLLALYFCYYWNLQCPFQKGFTEKVKMIIRRVKYYSFFFNLSNTVKESVYILLLI